MQTKIADGNDFVRKSLEAYKLKTGESWDEIAKKIGVSAQMLRLVRKGNRNFGTNTLYRFKAWAVSVGEKVNDSKSTDIITRDVSPAPPITTRYVPVISWAMASAFLDHDAGNFGDLEHIIDEHLHCETKDPNAYALIIEGPSMMPIFPPGTRVVASPNVEPRNGDLVIARVKSTGQVMFKRCAFLGDHWERVRLESLNEKFPPVEYPREELRILHPVVECRIFPRMVK